MAALHINPPENFTFSTPCNWSKWKMRFERYRIASGLSTKTGNEQVNSLLYIMGEQAEDIFSSFGLSETEQDDFDIVLKKFNDYFVVKKNTILNLLYTERELEDDSDVTGYQHSPADGDPGCPPLMSSPQSPKTYPERASSSTEASPDPYVTRSGRTVRPPERLDL
ncbi:hypothetical protein AVEN_192545-1 [Araneus ventricosus]|uniref:Uncharacterized protein n=1 Tax=Araneus ventricosus TaxID=182803 RepID=A0A4Y2FXW4_ARAVE|nr:hypothetical protein AVEN_192545-1 [Araneus ventricosus]